ncbi:FAD:protein FMN transferase [Jannaschia formosa]|uniref:FAD:protein FMN transferase n=1 Tax=Jannaschia formosa TaxID=2259592 RepID=UPI000E1B9BAB|nr:FAD:protein FMN transferase [Jannaschia formosa]TFL19166.1 FAD:protein FMN transferase [Jannaschia formosa]
MRRRRFLTLAAGLMAFPAFAGAPTRWSGIALGAEATLVLSAPEAVARPALAAALAEIREMERLFSLHDPASLLSRLNAEGRLDEAPTPFRDLLARVDALHRLTGGLFDPTVQPVWEALARGETAPGITQVGWSRVRLDGGSVRLGARQKLTLNGIAQGYATDRVVAVLRAHGLSDAFVDIGEQAALGAPRRLGVEDPAQGLVGTITLRDGAVATSSPAATPLGRTGHILHPARPGAAPFWATVTVEAEDATLADGLSTALCHADLALARRLRSAPGLRQILLVSAEGDLRTL